MRAGRRPAKLGTFEQMRAWAAATGLLLAGWYLGGSLAGDAPGDIVAMLVTAIGGFEFALYAKDLWRGRKARHG
jgi:hypothetical protein